VTRYALDSSVERHGDVVVGGSPLRLFRLTTAGRMMVERIAAGEHVPESALVARLLDAGAIHPRGDRGTAPYAAADVTIVVPAHGAPAHLPDHPGRVVLVDDGSEPPLPGVTVRLAANAGPASARNAGLERVRTPLVAFVDTDVELSAGWLDPLLPHFADPHIGLVAPRVSGAPRAGAVARYERRHSPLDLGAEPARIRAGSRVSYVPAAAIVCRLEALRAIGGFDAALRVGEDVDLVWRLDAAGWRCRYEPASVVHHEPRPTWTAWWCQRVAYGSSAAPLAERHPGALAPLRMSGWSLATWLLGVIGHPLAGGAIGVASAAALARKLPELPARAAFRLAAVGNARAGQQIAAAVRRAWWPLVAVAALRSKGARKVLAASAVAATHPIRLADDVAYSVGLWRGVVARRTIAPLVPDVSSWPGRQPAGGRPAGVVEP
jgi:mycofactocin system glycosyltransferase